MPITFERFVINQDPRNITCMNCSAKLKANRLLYRIYYIGILAGLLAGGVAIILAEVYDWSVEIAFLVVIAIAVVLLLPVEIYAWKHGAYIEKRKE